MKKSPLKRGTKMLKKTRLKMRGTSDTSILKERIQVLVRKIVIARDKTCILRNIRRCTDEVYQADHLISRANSATYADTRLIVCLCRSCHGGFKKWHKVEYDALVRLILPPERVRLWDDAERYSWQANRTSSQDWKLWIIKLEQELREYEPT